MSIAILKVPPQFPVGTSVAAYPDTGQQPSGPPAVSALETHPVDANSLLTFTSLASSTRYWAGAPISGVWLYFEFTTPAAAPGGIGVADLGFDPATQVELDREVSILALHPKNFGAIGNGSADDTAALQAWLDNIPEYGTGDCSGGTYLFSSLTCDTDHITVTGNARFISTIPNDGVTNAVWLAGSGVTVDGPTFEMQNPILPYNLVNWSNGVLLILGNHALPAADEVTMRNVTCRGAYTSGAEIRNARIARLENYKSFDCGQGGAITNCTEHVTVDGYHVERSGDDMLAVLTDTTVPGGTKNVKIRNFTGIDGDAKGIGLVGVDSFSIDGFYIENTWTFGIAVFEDSGLGKGAHRRGSISNGELRRCGYKFGSTPTNLHSSASVVPDAIYLGAASESVEIERSVRVIDTLGIGVIAETPAAPTTSTASRTFPAATDVPVADTANLPPQGTATIFLADGTSTKFSYTGRSTASGAGTLTGCTGGLGTFAGGSRVLIPTENIGIHCSVEGAGGAGVQVGDPAATDYIRFLDFNLDGVRTKRTVGGVILGGITGCQMLGFSIRSYKQGAAGSRRGLHYGRMRDFTFGMSRDFNDDGGDERILDGGNNQHVDQWNVQSYAAADA